MNTNCRVTITRKASTKTERTTSGLPGLGSPTTVVANMPARRWPLKWGKEVQQGQEKRLVTDMIACTGNRGIQPGDIVTDDVTSETYKVLDVKVYSAHTELLLEAAS